MADNNTSRFRSTDPFGRGPGPSGPANDPLAELARLIGQNDPFAEFGAHPQGQQPVQGGQGGYDNNYPPQPYNGHPTEPYLPEPAPQAYSPEYSPEPAQHYQPHVPPRFDPAQQQPNDDWPGSSAPSNSYQQPDSYGVPPPMRPVPGFDTPVYSDAMLRPSDDFRPERGGTDSLPSFLTSPDRQSQQPGFEPHPYAQQPPIYPTGPDVGAMPAPHDDEFYDDAPRGGRRKGLLTVAAVRKSVV